MGVGTLRVGALVVVLRAHVLAPRNLGVAREVPAAARSRINRELLHVETWVPNTDVCETTCAYR